jgi:transposase
VYGHDDVLLLVKTVTEPPPDAATWWTMEAIAQRLSEHGVPISPSQVWRR